jgi:hypothetical protein
VWHSPTRSESLSNAVKSNMSQSSIRAGLGGRADWAGPWGVAARGVARQVNMAGANQADGFDEALALTPACVSLTLTLTACRPKKLQKLKSSRPLDCIPHIHIHSHSSHPQLIHFHSPALTSTSTSTSTPLTSQCKPQEPPSAPSGLSRPVTFT